MFGNQFICSFEPEAHLDTGMVLHQGYLLGGPYHGHDSVFLLNCYGVRWQVEVKQTYANAMSVVGPIWSDFMSKNITQDVKCLHFIKEGEDMFYVATYNKYGLEMHGYKQKSLTVFNTAGEALTACDNYASYVLQNSNCHIRQEPDYNLERMGWYCNWRWHTNHGDKRRAFYIKLTLDVLILGQICISKGFIDRNKLRGYASVVVSHKDKKFEFKLCKKSKSIEMFSTTTLRIESYALKFADDVLLGIFMNVPAAWGRPVWTGVDDILLLALVLKHLVPSLLA
ncbi:hypothetical protein Tco_0862418 [Tanacetum coccineum]